MEQENPPTRDFCWKRLTTRKTLLAVARCVRNLPSPFDLPASTVLLDDATPILLAIRAGGV